MYYTLKKAQLTCNLEKNFHNQFRPHNHCLNKDSICCHKAVLPSPLEQLLIWMTLKKTPLILKLQPMKMKNLLDYEMWKLRMNRVVGVLKEALKFVVVVVAAVAVVVVAALQSIPLTFPMNIKKKIFNRKLFLLGQKTIKKFF